MTRTDAVFRVIAAPPARLYAALVDPDALVRWLPPEGMTGQVERFGPRPGGAYRMIIGYAAEDAGAGKTDAASDAVEGECRRAMPA